MGEPLRVGIVGCGFATQDRHLPAISRTAEVECVALADVDRATLDEVGERWRVPRRYVDVSDLVCDPDVEAVAVCVPAAKHVEIALAALAHGRHVLVEKPIALSLDDADRLVEGAGSSPAKVLVGFNLRWHRLVGEAREALRSGDLGRIQAVRTVFSDSTLARPGLPEWRRRRALGGGGLLDKGVHHFDLIRYLLDDDIAVVAAWSLGDRGADDEVVAVSGRTAGGALLSMQFMDATTLGNEITLYGENASLHLDCYRSDGLELSGLNDMPGAPRTRLRRIGTSLRQLQHIGELRLGGVFDASYRAEWRHFADAVRRDLEPECGLEDGRRALQVALAAAQAAAVGQPTDVARAPRGVDEIIAPDSR